MSFLDCLAKATRVANKPIFYDQSVEDRPWMLYWFA